MARKQLLGCLLGLLPWLSGCCLHGDWNLQLQHVPWCAAVCGPGNCGSGGCSSGCSEGGMGGGAAPIATTNQRGRFHPVPTRPVFATRTVAYHAAEPTPAAPEMLKTPSAPPAALPPATMEMTPSEEVPAPPAVEPQPNPTKAEPIRAPAPAKRKKPRTAARPRSNANTLSGSPPMGRVVLYSASPSPPQAEEASTTPVAEDGLRWRPYR